jgi:two-component system sensor histidine kinase YesM
MEKTDWRIVSLHSMSSYNRKALSLIQFIIIISAVFFIISATVAVLMSLAITKPIKNLTHLMKKVENEDFNVHFTTRSVDEIATMGHVFNSMIDRIRNLIKSVYKSKLAEKDAVIYALQSQINPHFLHNTLQSISNIALLEGPSDIANMCRCLSSMFRYSIEGKRRFVMLYDEVTHINNYFYLLSIQHKDRIRYLADINEDLLLIRVPRFILQPLVENSVFHGLDSMSSGGEIKVYAILENDILKVTVEDNGIGMGESFLLHFFRPSLFILCFRPF